MSKKTFALFILLLLGIIALIGWLLFFRNTPAETPGTTQQGTDLFPFGPGSTGTTSATTTPGGTGTGQGEPVSSTEKLPRLRQLWKDPTAGATFFPGSGTTTAIRFVDRATGHIYEAPIDALGNSKLSNVTIPQIHEALWAENGNELIFRYLKNSTTIQSFYAVMATGTAENALEGYFLPENIRDLAVQGNKMLYFNPSVQIGSLTQANIDGTAKKVIMSSEARDWALSYTNQKSVFLETRPSGEIKGFGYALDLATGATTKIAGDILGLTGTINPAGNRAFMSAAEKNSVVSAHYDILTKKTSPLSIRTLSDKCAWSNTRSNAIYCGVPAGIPSGIYPDDWYKGKVSFSDRLIEIDLSTGEATPLLDPSFDGLQEMDIMKITVNKADKALTFINKKDMSLWLYMLTDDY